MLIVLWPRLAVGTDAPPPAATDMGAFFTERLLATPPPKWRQTYQLNSVLTRISEFIPLVENTDNWKTRLHVESFVGPMDPIEFLLDLKRAHQNECDFVQHFAISTGLENGYPTSVRLVLCGTSKETGQGKILLYKAIAGNAYSYVFELHRRVPPFSISDAGIENAEVAAWSMYFRGFTLCDSAREEHPCPQPAADAVAADEAY